MRGSLTGFLLSLALCGVALADAAAGRALYATKCKVCHGANGEGNPVIAKMADVTLRPLGSKAVQRKSDAELKKESREGPGWTLVGKNLEQKQTSKMKPVKLTDAEAGDIVVFLRTLK